MAEPAVAQAAITSRYLDDEEEIARAFRTLRDRRSDLNIQFDGVPGGYTARVLDTSEPNFYIDDIQPRDGARHLSNGVTFSFSGRADGVYIYAAANAVKEERAERGMPYYVVRLPATLLYQQRRRRNRIVLPMRVAANGAQLTLYRDTPVRGRIVDISVGGCRAEFFGNIEPAITLDEEVGNCEIQIPKLLEVYAKGVVRHFSFNKTRECMATGVEFTEMHVTDRRRLEQFIQSLSRSTNRE